MKKRSFVITVVAIMVAMSIIVAAAAVYISSQARMGLFSGRIEQTTSKPDDPKLILKVAGENVGQDGDVSVYNEAVFPVLTNVTSNYGYGFSTYTDENGREPISAPRFVLSAENGNVENVYYKIVVQGNDKIAEALRFGINTKYLDENGHYAYLSGTDSVSYHQTETQPRSVKADNDTIVEGEEIEFSISAWVDSYALAKVGDYDENMSFSVEIVFFTQELS